ncbi:MAG: Protein-disulfide reductase [Bacteroidota bacterium]|jgi:thiol:disulfide interchange protein DsbD
MKLKYLLLFLFISVQLYGQKMTPAKWSWSLSPAQPSVGQEAELIFKVTIDKGWYLYSSDFDKDLGPVVTTISIKPGLGVESVGPLKAINPHSKEDKEIWGGTYTYFTEQGEFRQKVKFTSENWVIDGSYDSQTCSNESGLCVPIKGNFKISASEDSKKKASDVAGGGLIEFFFVALGAGLLALLTPCVYPLIPMTVSFFTKKQGGKRLAILYGLFIVLIYVFFGTILAFFAGASFANFLSTHWIPNLLFFVIFVFFGISFLGAFEIVLPSGLVNSVDAKSDKGGLMGVFFMAFTLVLVSFSCTGPLAGSILIAASQGVFLKPIIGMLGFSLAFAIPFTLFAVFPGFMKSLPKSGNWMNEVKVVLGFLEIALAFKFLSVADQVYHWHLLDREIFLAIWIAVFTALTLYLFGKISLPHDGPAKNLSVPRTLFATAVLAFVIYLIPGMFGAPLKGLSGWLPPLSSQDFKGSATSLAAPVKTDQGQKKYADFLTLPLGLQGFFDFEEAKAYALQVNKPLFIDFTGHGCVNCRKMEENVWSDPQVLKRLQEKYVVVALYCDDKTELPAEQWYVSKVDGQEKKTLGDQNLDFQITRFNSNAQPHYVLLDPRKDAAPMVKPVAFDADINHFVSFLDQGLVIYQAAN